MRNDIFPSPSNGEEKGPGVDKRFKIENLVQEDYLVMIGKKARDDDLTILNGAV
jgi:hypothetical protein